MNIVVRDEGDGPIYCGGRFDGDIFSGSIGEFIADLLEKGNPDDVRHINAATGELMTGKEFLDLTWRICGGLKELGIKTGDIVILSGENSFRNAAAATAGFLLNAPFAPIDPHLKPFELKNVLANYQPSYVFCNGAQANDFASVLKTLNIDAPIIILDKDEVEDARFIGFSFILMQDALRVVPAGVQDPTKEIAMVIPSSGSTGLPKGVAFSHRSVAFAACKMLQHPWGQKGQFLQTSHLFWISGIFSLLGCLLGQTRIFLPELRTDAIIAAIKKFKPTMAFISPSELTTILKNPDMDPELFSPLTVIGTGGGPITQFIIDNFKKRVTSSTVLANAYGMTENCGSVTKFVPGSDIMSVGVADTECDIKIVDPETEKILEQGEIGEIRVRSKYQFIGYLGNSEATKAAYDEQGFLRSGDLGYFSPDYFLYITGRIKNLIKYRNMQISPEEVESLIIDMEGVADVGVDGVPHKEDQYHAVALVVKTPGSTVTQQQIADYVKENMSEHNWLRGGVIFVDEIPRTFHKKTKRDQLKQLVYKIAGYEAS